MNVTVQSTTIPNYQRGGSTASIRIYCDSSFFAGGLEYVPGLGYFYKSVACTVSGTTITVPSFTLQSTTDSSNDAAKYIAVLYDDTGARVATLMGGIEFSVPPDTPITWSELMVYNQAVVRQMPDTYYTADQTAYLLSQKVDINSPKIMRPSLSEDYANDLAAAVTAIGGASTDLFVLENATISSNVTVPVNIRLRILRGAVLSVDTGITLTINSAFEHDNEQCFSGSGNVYFGTGCIKEYKTAWWTGPTPTTITTALNKALSAAANTPGTTIVIPNGEWSTTGEHQLPSYTHIKGEGGGNVLDSGVTKGTTLKVTVDNAKIFKQLAAAMWSTHLSDLMLRCDSRPGSVGISLAAPSGTVDVLDFVCRNVKIQAAATGVSIDDASGNGAFRQVRFDRDCTLSYCEIGLYVNANNTVINYDGQILAAATNTSKAVYIGSVGCGYLGFNGVEFAGGFGSPGSRQAIKQTVVAPSGITSSGNARCVITRNSIVGPTVTFPVTTTEHTTATLIAKAAAQALAKHKDVMLEYNVGWNGSSDFYLCTLDEAANDATFNVTIENVTCAGISNDLTSSSHIAGVAPAATIPQAAFLIEGPARALHINGCWIEGYFSAMEINNNIVVGEVQNNISIVGGIIGHAIRIQGGDYGTLMLDSVQCWPKTIRNESGAMHVIIRGKTQMLQTIAGYSAMGLENVHCNTSINAYPGTVRVDAPGEPLWGGPEYEVQDRFKVTRTGASGASSTDPWLQVLTENEKQFRLGILDSNRDFVGYDIYRNSSTGALEFDGSHPAFTSYNFDGDVTVPAEAYGVGWNGSNEVPTKNDVYDKVETIGITVGNAVTGGGANRVIYEDASQNVATSSRFTYSGGNLGVAGGATTDYTEIQSLQTGGDGNARMALGVGGTATGDGYQDKGYVLAGSSLAGMLIQASGPIELSSPSVSSTGDITVPGEAYGVSWNGSNEVPTKNDVYDKIETIGGLTVGNTVTGGGVNRVLYENGSQALSASANLTYGAASSQLKITSGAAADVPFNIKAAASQSGNLLEIDSSAGSSGDLFRIKSNGQVVVPASNSTSAANIHFIDTSNAAFPLGIQLDGATNGAISFYYGGARYGAFIGSSGWTVRSAGAFNWSSTADAVTGAADTGLARAAAKVIKLTDGSTGNATLSSVPLSPTALAANTDNYNPGTARHLRLSASSAVNLTGIVAGVDGQELFIWNVGTTNTITLKHQVTSTAANQFFTTTGADLALAAGKCAIAMYDGTTSRWRVSLLP